MSNGVSESDLNFVVFMELLAPVIKVIGRAVKQWDEIDVVGPEDTDMTVWGITAGQARRLISLAEDI